MVRPYATPVNDPQRRTQRLLVQVPICVAAALSLSLMVTRFILTLKENLQSNPDGWRGVLVLAAILGAASFLAVLTCAAIGAVIGFALQFVFARRPAARRLAARRGD